jgi:hypothetical protein
MQIPPTNPMSYVMEGEGKQSLTKGPCLVKSIIIYSIRKLQLEDGRL